MPRGPRLKNLSHVRFGRMGKRFEQASHLRLLRAVESATDHRFDAQTLDTTAVGAGEADLRTGAYIVAIEKIAIIYQDRGTFP